MFEEGRWLTSQIALAARGVRGSGIRSSPTSDSKCTPGEGKEEKKK